MATIPLPSDFSEFLKLLNAHEVKYLLVGGYAVGYYGYVRATADMDIWTEIDGVEFSSCYKNRELGVWDDVIVSLISLADLKTNKKASGRNKDLTDLDYLP